MVIYNRYEVRISGASATLDKDILLTRGDKDVSLIFNIDKFGFKSKTNFTKVEMTLLKPNMDTVFLNPTIEEGEIVVKISEDIIDESIEVGGYSFQFSLFDSEDSKISIPIIHNQFYVSEPLGKNVGSSDKVDNSLSNSAYSSGNSSNMSVLNNDGTFNKKTWGDKNVISSEKLNQYENAFDMLFDNKISVKTIVDGVITLDNSKYQQAEVENEVTIKLPSATYNSKFILFLNCLQTVAVSFKSTSSINTIKLEKGYYAIELYYIGDWIIKY